MFPDARENEIVVIAEVVELKPAVNSEKAVVAFVSCTESTEYDLAEVPA
jgi:hypothetical protein